MAEERPGESTLGLIEELRGRGVDRMTVLMRHGARHYDSRGPDHEPFQPLTEEGKADAYAFGLGLPGDLPLSFLSSLWGRCIETAYQVEKGCIAQGAETTVNATAPYLAPFYIQDLPGFIAQYAEMGREAVLRSWFDGGAVEKVLMPAAESIRTQLTPVLARLREEDGPRIEVAVTHDWNLYLIRELCLHQRTEEAGKVRYLEGVAFFLRDGTLHAMNLLGGPEPVTGLGA